MTGTVPTVMIIPCIMLTVSNLEDSVAVSGVEKDHTDFKYAN